MDKAISLETYFSSDAEINNGEAAHPDEKRSFPLLHLASPLLSTLAYAPSLHHVSNPVLLYQNLVYTVQNLEAQLRATYPHTSLKIASYLLCITLDELIIDPLNRTQNLEINRTLTYLYQDTQGEKRFFKIVDVLIEKAAISQELLILAYLCLSLGYRGPYRQASKESLDYLTRKLYTTIHSPHYPIKQDNIPTSPMNRIKKNVVPYYRSLIGLTNLMMGLGITYSFFAFTLHDYSRTIVNLL